MTPRTILVKEMQVLRCSDKRETDMKVVTNNMR